MGNMHETPVNFDMVGNRIVKTKGVKIVQLRNTGND